VKVNCGSDYYKFIAQPISLNDIKNKIPTYQHPRDFYEDFLQLFLNAKRYNSEGVYSPPFFAFLIESNSW
jgi:hypothetical protein